ncbi:MAG: RNA polymerase sigma factor [Phycisphaerae bacterium]
MGETGNGQSDANLVAGARRGDIECFGLLYSRYYGSVLAVGLALLGDRDQAEDAAQETFAVACGSLTALRRADRFAHWLRGICRRVARNMLRRNRRTFPPKPADEPKEIDVELNELVRRSVSRLPASGREIVLLHYFSGMTHKDIANMLRISPQAVHGRLVRARRKLAEILTTEGIGNQT